MPDDLRARIAEALNTSPAGILRDHPDSLAFHIAGLNERILSSRHDRHNYLATCALCRGEADTLAEAVLAVVQPELDRRAAEREHARRSAEFRSLEIDRQRDRLRELEETVARWRQRAERAEAAIARVRAYCTLAADSCRVAARETAQDVLRLLNGAAPTEPFEPPPGAGVCDRCKQWGTAVAPFPRCPDCGRTWDRVTAPEEPPYDLPTTTPKES